MARASWQADRRFLFGVGAGAFVFTFAGAAWILVGLIYWPEARPWEFAVAAAPAVALAGACFRHFAATARLSEPVRADRDAIAQRVSHLRRTFGAVVVIEVAAIVAAARLLTWAGRPLLIPVAIVAIVGAHFLPLARLFHIRTYSVVGAVMLAAAAGSLLIPDEPTRVFLVAITAGVVLWLGAFAVLVTYTPLRSEVARG